MASRLCLYGSAQGALACRDSALQGLWRRGLGALGLQWSHSQTCEMACSLRKESGEWVMGDQAAICGKDPELLKDQLQQEGKRRVAAHVPPSSCTPFCPPHLLYPLPPPVHLPVSPRLLLSPSCTPSCPPHLLWDLLSTAAPASALQNLLWRSGLAFSPPTTCVVSVSHLVSELP